MIILIEAARLIFLQQCPFGLHTIFVGILPRAEAEVVEDRLHAILMLLGDVAFHIFHSHPSVAYVLIPLCERAVGVKLYRLVVHPLPVLKLHAVDVETVQICHLRLYVSVLVDGALVIVKIGHEAIAREARPLARHINGDGAHYCLGAVGSGGEQLCHVALIINLRWCPRP